MMAYGTPLSTKSVSLGGNEALKQLEFDLSLKVYQPQRTAVPMPRDVTGTSG